MQFDSRFDNSTVIVWIFSQFAVVPGLGAADFLIGPIKRLVIYQLKKDCKMTKILTMPAMAAGLQREAEDRIAQNARNIDHERSFMNLFIHGLDESGDPIVNHEKPDESLEDRIYGRINEVGAKVRRGRQETSVERGRNTKESVCCEGMILQVSHERSLELLAGDGMLDENG